VIWIGIDPGSRKTGLVLRNGSDCLGWNTVERLDDETPIGVGPRYWDHIGELVDAMHGAIARLVADPRYTYGGIAIEGVNVAGGFRDGKKQFAKPADLMALSATWAALWRDHPDAVIVPPGGNGRGLLAGYPEQLITDGERRHGLNREAPSSSLVSHARSAWDVAGIAARAQGRAA
jgi:hypothetical protein